MKNKSDHLYGDIIPVYWQEYIFRGGYFNYIFIDDYDII